METLQKWNMHKINVQFAGQLILQKTGNGKRKEKQLYKL